MKARIHPSSWIAFRNKNVVVAIAVAVAIFAVGYVLYASYAAGPAVELEAENAELSGVKVIDDSTASDGKTLQFGASGATTPPPSTAVPTLQTTTVASGLGKLWDIGFLPDGNMLISHFDGRLSVRGATGPVRTVSTVPGVRVLGEGGLMGLAIDGGFAQNRFIYTCYASQENDVRLVRWRVAEDYGSVTDRKDIITGINYAPSGRHSGCRVRMDNANVLWVGTGDAAIGTVPQDPKALGGKILRVDREGQAANGNLNAPFDERIYSFGHRNTQGLALYETPQNGSAGFSVEHGPGIDDEVNQLIPGNFGWNPVPGYNEGVPMTNTSAYPSAVAAVWKSGNPTTAPSGATLLRGAQWKAWDGRLAVAVLKGAHLMVQQYDQSGRLQKSDVVLKDQFGRIRTAVQGPDGNLYLATDAGSIVRVVPQ